MLAYLHHDIENKEWSTLWHCKAYLYYFFRRMPLVGHYLRAEQRLLSSLLASLPRKRIVALDIATGTGDSARCLHRDYMHIAIDRSMRMLLFAKKKLREAHLLQADALALPVRRNSAGIVQCIGLAEYYKDISALLEALSDCLSENGFLIISSAPRTLFSSLRNVLGLRVYRHSPDTISAGIAHARLALKMQVQSRTQVLYLLKKEVDSN